MDTRSARRGRSSPVGGDSVESASPIAIEAIKPESSATASPLASSTAVNLNGTAAAGASEPMETTETDEAETVTKKRKTGTGSRGVANLTPEQLAKKRANDREAQRAIRERTKNQIERLEKRIRELESQKPYQDLQVVVRAKEAIEAENAEIKRRLATIITMLQPIVGTSDPGVPSTLPSAAAPTAVPVTSSVPYHPAAPVGGVADPQRQPTQPPLQSWSSAGSSSSPPPHRAGLAGAVDEGTRLMLEQQGHSLRHGLDFGSGRFDFNVVLDPIQAIPKLQRGRDGAQDTGEFHHVAMKHDWTQVSQDNARPTSTWDSPLAIPSPGSDPASGVLSKAVTSQPASSSGLGLDGAAPNIPPVPFSDTQAANIVESLPLWARPLRNCEPTCPLDALLLDFRSERQQRAAEGYEPNEVTGPRYPSVSSLLNPANSKYSHPVSKVFTDIVGKFPEISRLPEKVTILYLMFIYMRWQISPTKENHERLPEWIRPLPCQLDIPHPAWMDYLPYPEMRERVILANDPSIFYFDNWFLPFTSTFTISWPYEEAHTLLRNPDSDEIMINPVFESHMRNLDNWKVGRAFAEAFPMLVDTCKFWDGTNQQQSPT